MLLGIIFVFVICYETAVSGCEPPLFGSIERGENNRVTLKCDEGFKKLGPSEGICDELTGQIDAQVICLPILKGKDKCGDMCPKDRTYILDFQLNNATSEQIDAANEIRKAFKADQIARGGRRILCETVCKLDIRSCFANLPRKVKRQCCNCFLKNKCGLAFWG